ncbi:2-oxoglutarate dehydrogenase complex dihydrolipoyllysine-residue succinyltransferase [Methylocystis sp. MJC1]|jgi:2-oxoglutarate dehydrogenase E2 component (dihydrolipoamide succinyltransferase)|uniref:2-oxoglutarate dehydrogenase complex dihydrolipoyllysine-residue succinyltransferase n=1 Tax=Methylocystis sp. MJC1 TaxID=2654282 RepID=UPI0013EA5318|nr:2-oxoglutarate dehydrogenase complex dihydrolipoyllysine-residue succinyltransferase [Methylocystis sp. MJC1]KAF2989582.1 Dihydrolipoyllysine-residue succinyltransferase component of 2-oxoglutarate dehydrogenase complex [Methylocystis sp. MJC1]MBU6528504.1 2-oxoglutarate dehydrogenase complex dihydrolipoyllysine-residue succinyltransferase [Methylocystis sp. MJC1]UZX11402.1 2-oxoglutarate dehydrogenase complex dihydrolipoyllysine-residue succinyltransferase [Methylocystis sp. MJC1]
MTEIRVPTLGESVTEATIGRWFKKAGDTVRADETLAELETDKVTLEVNAPAAGVLAEVLVKEGETVQPGALLGQIVAGGAAVAPAPAAKPSPAPAAAAPAPAAPSQPPTAMPPSPAAAKIAAEKGIDVSQVAGSGKRGQALKSDVIDFAARAPAAPAPIVEAPPPPIPRAPAPQEDASREERVKMSRLRQTIARRLKEAQSVAAMLTTFNEVDMSALIAQRNKYKDLFEKKHGVKLGFMSYFVKACCQALEEIPAVNAEIDGTDIIYKRFCHIGVAVGTDKGLVVPVVRDADRMSLAEIEKSIAALGKKAREGALDIADLQGGTFTISNGGVYGSLMSTPILNAPQSGILGMHKIQERPVAVEGKIEIRPMMYLALSYDHRIVDGKEAVTFLVRVKETLEDPGRLALAL